MKSTSKKNSLSVKPSPRQRAAHPFVPPPVGPPSCKDLDDGCLRLLPKPSPLTTPGSIADTTATDAVTDHPASASRLREESLRAWAEYQGALAGGKAASDAAAMDLDRDNKEASGRGGKPKRESDRGAYREYGGIGVMMLDVWGNQPWRLDEKGAATAKGEEGPGFHPKSLLSKR